MRTFSFKAFSFVSIRCGKMFSPRSGKGIATREAD